MSRIHWLLLTSVALTGFAGQTAMAQQQSETKLEAIVVKGDRDAGGPVEGYVAKSSRTASKTGTPLLETQQSVSVITHDEIEAQGAQTVGQALNYTPGVLGQPFGTDPRFDAPIIRGFDGRQVQFLNGLRMMRTAGAPAFEIYGLENIDVLRGPASVMYGQGNPGGIINMISKKPVFENFGEVGVQGGSYETIGGFFDFGGTLGEQSDFAYRLTGLGKNAAAQVDELDNDRYFIAPALTWQPDEDTKLTILASVQHDNPSTPSGLPPQYTLNATDFRLPRDFYVGNESFDRSSRTLANLGYEFEHRLSESWIFRQSFRYSDFNWDYQSLGMSTLGLAADGRTLRRNATFQDEALNTVNIDNNLQGEFSTGDVDHTLLFGLDYRHFGNNVRTRFYQATPLDVRSPSYGEPIRLIAPTLDTTVDSELSQLGVYVQDELALGGWRATLGFRQDWTSSAGTSLNGLTRVSRPLDQDDHELAGRAGLSYIFDNGIAPYVSYSSSFEPVIGAGPDGRPFEPTSGEQVELGVKYEPTDWNGFFTAAAYDLKQKNVLRTIAGISSQIGEVNVRGLELEAVASITQGLDLRASYTYTDARIASGADDGNRVENVPEHMASLWANYTFQEGTALEGLGIGAGVRYVGQRYGNSANTFNLDSVVLADFALSFKKNGYKASLNVQNVFDKDYVASCSSFGCYYGDGRTFMGKLTYSW
ncbi:ligand-gated channel [Ensifer sp. Root1252]|nr:ligand-gated channel [Ensifer sp. Root31]KQW59882.1 ligand-gated channel [Ensifer sp. Root1252]KRC74044.1 ligand-gated channel [Ensifer sp. Root231]KRC96955.1 ligand-gated channel [Ensifer sp. Root258]